METTNEFTAVLPLTQEENDFLFFLLKETQYTGELGAYVDDNNNYSFELTRDQVGDLIGRIDYYLADVIQLNSISDEAIKADKHLQDTILYLSQVGIKLTELIYTRK